MNGTAEIPVKNVYYLLCYAWRRLTEHDLLAVDTDGVTELVDLFGRVLLRGVSHLRRRGMDRGYLSREERTSTLRGRIVLDRTLREGLLQHGLVWCRHDELSHDVLHNRILRSTLETLAHDPMIDPDLAQKLATATRWFEGVHRVRLTPSVFRRVQLHRNNAIYGFLLDIAKLVMERLLVSEGSGRSLFSGFLRDEGEMRRLFEQFVRNFYSIELEEGLVGAKKLAWAATSLDEKSDSVLPAMITDVAVEYEDRTIILDTKYTAKSLVESYHGVGNRLRTEHLYQIYAYVRNAEILGDKWAHCEGILLYPCVHDRFRYEYDIAGHRVRVCSVDLAAHWLSIREELLALMDPARGR